MDRISKTEGELKKTVRIQQQNINRLYSICSTLYQEIQDLKHHTNYKVSDGMESTEKMPNMKQTTNISEEDFVVGQNSSSSSGSGNGSGMRRKIINN